LPAEQWRHGSETDPTGCSSSSTPRLSSPQLRRVGPSTVTRAFRTNLESWLEEWDDFRVEIREILDSGARVLVALQISARGKGSGLEVAMPIYEVFELRNGLAVTWEEYADREEALEAAGLRE
jgi:limonene-1,2-epoxide hydrolase